MCEKSKDLNAQLQRREDKVTIYTLELLAIGDLPTKERQDLKMCLARLKREINAIKQELKSLNLELSGEPGFAHPKHFYSVAGELKVVMTISDLRVKSDNLFSKNNF